MLDEVIFSQGDDEEPSRGNAEDDGSYPEGTLVYNEDEDDESYEASDKGESGASCETMLNTSQLSSSSGGELENGDQSGVRVSSEEKFPGPRIRSGVSAMYTALGVNLPVQMHSRRVQLFSVENAL